MSNVTASFFLQIVPSKWRGGKVVEAKAVRMTQGRPSTTEPGAVVTKMSLTLPTEVFEPIPPIDVIIPAENITQAPQVGTQPVPRYLEGEDA